MFPLFFGISEDPGRMVAELQRRGMVGSVYAAFAALLGLYAVGAGSLALEFMTSCAMNSWPLAAVECIACLIENSAPFILRR